MVMSGYSISDLLLSHRVCLILEGGRCKIEDSEVVEGAVGGAKVTVYNVKLNVDVQYVLARLF